MAIDKDSASLTVSRGDTIVQRLPLTRERLSIGRRLHNDLVLDHPAISGEHAVIVTLGADSFLEDLNSTNGTLVNGQPVKKHFLQSGDVIELAKYTLRYHAPAANAQAPRPRARLKVVTGAAAGRELFLDRPLIRLSRSGRQVAAILEDGGGHSLRRTDADAPLSLNGRAVGMDLLPLQPGDVVALGTIQLVFDTE
ncbi:MAG: FHA domain-containing protein [Burkholderiaceae bacterium]